MPATTFRSRNSTGDALSFPADGSIVFIFCSLDNFRAYVKALVIGRSPGTREGANDLHGFVHLLINARSQLVRIHVDVDVRRDSLAIERFAFGDVPTKWKTRTSAVRRLGIPRSVERINRMGYV